MKTWKEMEFCGQHQLNERDKVQANKTRINLIRKVQIGSSLTSG